MIYTAFHTNDERYNAEADRLRRSLDRLELPHDIRIIEDRGNWRDNTQQAATHVCQVMADYPDQPVILLDADAVVWRRPVLFDQFAEKGGVDIAVHYRRDEVLLNGTVYFAATKKAKKVAELYRQNVADNPTVPSEQTMLALALTQLEKEKVRVYKLPAGYCWIHDVMRDDMAPGEELVIEQLQASRHYHNSPALPDRMKRLAEIGG
jgi:hypothetical protein